MTPEVRRRTIEVLDRRILEAGSSGSSSCELVLSHPVESVTADCGRIRLLLGLFAYFGLGAWYNVSYS